MANISLKRPNYVVADLDRALALYRDIIGFELTFTKDSDSSSYSYPTFGFDPDAKLRFAVLSTPDQPNVFALTELKGQDLAPITAPRNHAIVVNVEDFDGVQGKIQAAGYHMFEEAKLLTQAGTTGREQGFLDADGHMVLIYKMDSQ